MASDDSADVVVVGTGVVGCLIAQQALDAGLSVLMLEAGPRVDRWRVVENFRNLPPSIRLFHWNAAYPPKPWAPHLETRMTKEQEQYLQLEGPNARAYLQGYVRYAGGRDLALGRNLLAHHARGHAAEEPLWGRPGLATQP